MKHVKNMFVDIKQNRRIIISFIVAVAVILTYYHLNLHPWVWYANKKFVGVGHPCATPDKEMNDLRKLITDVNEILNQLKLTHILIYGSLWGALRYNEPLPWDNDVDMALFHDEVRNMDESKFFDAFQKRNIDIYYRAWLGTYRITRDTARGDLMIFKKSFFNNMWRTGVEPWVFFINYKRFHTFPASLIEKPLPTLTFAGTNFSVPRHGVEIQKHFYPDDWWKESKPKGC